MRYKQYESAAEDRERAFTLLYKFFFPKNAPNRSRRSGPLREPILRSLGVDFHLYGVRDRIVLADYFQETTITRSTFIDHNNPVIGPLLRPDPGQTHCYQTVNLLYEKTLEV